MVKISNKAEQTLKQVNPVNELLNVTEGVISFAGGLPSSELVNHHNYVEILNRACLDVNQSIFQYGQIEGDRELRELISEWVERYGINTSDSEVMITSGGTQAIELMTEFFIDPGDYIFVDQYSFVSALEIFKSYKAEVIPVESDEDGIIIECLEEKLKKYHPKFLYIVTNYNNPTGYSLSKDRRRKMVDIMNEFDITIIEDDPYIELNYDAPFIKPIKSSGHPNVIYLSSFSKIISPGLRVGYIIAHEDIIRKVMKLKENKDVHTSNLSQFVVREIVKDHFETYLDTLRRQYKAKRETMQHYLDLYLHTNVEYRSPKGGMFLWVLLKEEINVTELLNFTLKRGVTFIPGSVFCPEYNEGSGNYIRLNFTNPDHAQIKTGIERVGECIKNMQDSIVTI
ncbi:PLP-dependent aminotransferase family protein [Rossellomorea sp. LjRoot5]|uniref:aminotransferase-like domain-containing protein n=1 Tax=Rossellomorea sp. LjRoot5 TaxID=3342331 RepID=UPI003ED1459B